MEQCDITQSTYGPLSLVPQPTRHPRPGQLGLKPATAFTPHVKPHGATKTPKQNVTRPDSAATKRWLKEKYHISSELDDAASQAVVDAAPPTAQQPSNAQIQRQHVLQHLAKFTQRAAAIKSTAEAVQEWYQNGGPATATAAAVLPAEALLVLNSEANRGLLHLLDTGLVPAQLELTPGLCGRPDAPLHSRPTQLHPYEAKLATLPHRKMVAVWHTPTPPTSASSKPAAVIEAAAPSQGSHATVVPTSQPAATAAEGAATATAAQPRGYEDLLDALSEHQLLVYKGRLVQDTPQVLSFIRIAAPFWATVSVLLSQLEAVCRVFKVPLAVVDGQEILQLAKRIPSTTSSSSGTSSATAGDIAATSSLESTGAGEADTAKLAVGLPDLLCCIANLDELEDLFTSASDELVAAALTGKGAPSQTSPPAAQGTSSIPIAHNLVSVAPKGEQSAAHGSSTAGVDPELTAGHDSSAAPIAGDQPALAAGASPAGQQKVQAKLVRVQEPLLQTMVQARRDQDSAFQLLQAALRHHWQAVQQRPHVVLQLPSLPAWAVNTALQDSSTVGTQPYQQQHQMWRLLDVIGRSAAPAAQSDVGANIRSKSASAVAASCGRSVGESKARHVLVTSQEISKQIQTHWMQLVKLAGVSEPTRYVRFISISPSDSKAAGLPTSLPLTAHLMASEKGLNHCKRIITGHSSYSTSSPEPAATLSTENTMAYAVGGDSTTTAAAMWVPQRQQVPPGYIVPGCPCEHDVDLAVKLGLPVLGPTPQLAQVLASKIGARSLFAAAGIRLAPGGVLPRRPHHNSEEAAWQQMLSAICLQLVQWPQQQQWMMKLSQFRGTVGLAVLDLSVMQETAAAAAAAIQQWQLPLPQQPGPGQDPWDPLDLSSVPSEQLQLSVQQLLPALACELPLGLQLAQQAYWEKRAIELGCSATADDITVEEAGMELYLTELLNQGGVMELCLEQLVCCPLVQLLIEPSGTIKVIATQDKILHGGLSSPGSTFPSSCPEHMALVQAATAAGEAARAAGMLGYLQVSFLCTNNPARTPQQQPQLEVVRDTEEVAGQSDSSRESAVPDVLLWGCDLLPWASPDLAMFRLFDAVKQGSFEAAAGSYAMAEQHSQQQSGQQDQLQEGGPDWRGHIQQRPVKSEPVVQQVQQCHYACLHNPAQVLASRHLCELLHNSWLKPDAGVPNLPGSRVLGTIQKSCLQLHDYGTNGEVIVCIDSSSHDSTRQEQSYDKGTVVKYSEASRQCIQEQTDAAVSGIVCCCCGSSVVGALSCLSSLIARYDCS